jgi:hypothetical protein
MNNEAGGYELKAADSLCPIVQGGGPESEINAKTLRMRTVVLGWAVTKSVKKFLVVHKQKAVCLIINLCD